MSARLPTRVHPMLATLVPKRFHLPGWVYEEKYDGIRILAYKQGKRVRMLTRNDLDRTARFPAIADAISRLANETLILDGEVVAFDTRGVSRFQLLQRGDLSLRYALFDCLFRDGVDLRSKPLEVRRQELEEVVRTPSDLLFLSHRLAPNGLPHRQAQRLGGDSRQRQRQPLRRAPLPQMVEG